MISEHIQKIDIIPLSQDKQAKIGDKITDYEARVFYVDAVINTVRYAVVKIPDWREGDLSAGCSMFMYHVQEFFFPNFGKTLGTIDFEMFQDVNTGHILWVADKWRAPVKEEEVSSCL